MVLKKTLSGKTFVRIIALSSLLQGVGCKETQFNSFESASPRQIQKVSSLKMSTLTLEEQKEFSDFIKNYSRKSPSAKKIFFELAA